MLPTVEQRLDESVATGTLSEMRSKSTIRIFWFAVVAGFAVAGCGEDDDEDGSAERYCELVQELEQAGGEFFAEVEQDESATDEDFAEAERQFLEEQQDLFDELRDVAPEEIADDVEILLAAQEERAAGGEQEETSDEVSAAEERTLSFEEENCGN